MSTICSDIFVYANYDIHSNSQGIYCYYIILYYIIIVYVYQHWWQNIGRNFINNKNSVFYQYNETSWNDLIETELFKGFQFFPCSSSIDILCNSFISSPFCSLQQLGKSDFILGVEGRHVLIVFYPWVGVEGRSVLIVFYPWAGVEGRSVLIVFYPWGRRKICSVVFICHGWLLWLSNKELTSHM